VVGRDGAGVVETQEQLHERRLARAVAADQRHEISRYLSFSEREDIALLRAQSHGVREIARRVRRVAVDDLA
jgi:hypothetical protein